MGRRGPQPTPTAILEARGSVRASRRKGEVKYPAGHPTCPSWLSKEAKAEWRRQAKHLASVGLLADVDRAVLAVYCEAWGEFSEAIKAIESAGGVSKCKPALVRLKNAAVDRLVRAAAQFGFSPASRTRVQAASAAIEEDDASGEEPKLYQIRG